MFNIRNLSLTTVLLLAACASRRAEINSFTDGFSEGPCKFGRVRKEADPELPEQGFIPAVYCNNEKQKMFVLDKVWTDYDWAEVYYDGKGRYVAVMDWAIEGGFAVVPVIESRDGGKTWSTLSKIEKPHFSARITKLSFDEMGNGEVQMEWEPAGIVIAKLYSKDNGKSWVTGSR